MRNAGRRNSGNHASCGLFDRRQQFTPNDAEKRSASYSVNCRLAPSIGNKRLKQDMIEPGCAFVSEIFQPQRFRGLFLECPHSGRAQNIIEPREKVRKITVRVLHRCAVVNAMEAGRDDEEFQPSVKFAGSQVAMTEGVEGKKQETGGKQNGYTRSQEKDYGRIDQRA